MKQSKRIFYYDVLRAIAIIGIVFCHASISFVSKPNMMNLNYFIISSVFDCFRDFSIPIFVMLSGALLIGKKDTLTDFFKRRLSRLFIPFIFWVVIYAIYSFIFIRHSIDLNYALDIFLGAPGTLGVAFWFVWMIVLSYVGIFIINKAIQWGNSKHDGFDKKFISLLTLISLLFIACVSYSLFNPYSSRIVYFVSFLSYIVIGYFIANYALIGERINKKAIIVMTLLMFAASYAYYILSYVVPHSVNANQFVTLGYFSLLILFMSVNFFAFFKYLSKAGAFDKIENGTLGNLITVISRYSFGIYLSHYLVLNALKNNISTFVNYSSQNPLFWIPFLVITTLIICIVISLILNKIPYLNKFSGKA